MSTEHVEMAQCEVEGCGREVPAAEWRRHFKEVTICEDPLEIFTCCKGHTEAEIPRE